MRKDLWLAGNQRPHFVQLNELIVVSLRLNCDCLARPSWLSSSALAVGKMLFKQRWLLDRTLKIWRIAGKEACLSKWPPPTLKSTSFLAADELTPPTLSDVPFSAVGEKVGQNSEMPKNHQT